MRWPIVIFGLFAGFCLLCAWCAWVVSGAPEAADLSVEHGLWAVRFRIIEVAVLAIGTASVLLLIEQLNLTARWNKRLTYHQFFAEVPGIEKFQAFVKLAKEEKIDAYEENRPLPEDAVKRLIDDHEKKVIVLAYLNDFEEFAGAVRRGLVDNAYAYDLESCRVIRAWRVFEPYVRRLREHAVYVEAYREIEQLASEWTKKADSKNGNARPTQA